MKFIYFRVSSATTVFGSYKQRYNMVTWKSLKNGLINSSRRWNTLYMCSSPTRNLWTTRAKTLAKASSMYFIFFNQQNLLLYTTASLICVINWLTFLLGSNSAIQLSAEDIITFVNRHYTVSVKNVHYIKKAFF